ncbi:MAG: type IV toxin-antitoxin system AbiEi family antitoxin [Candidatus Tantalella remota]|nr:type IV toxin-antitoxin system AbiEi family antitoxin [Candidatus Tantalella remota]
MNRRKGSIINNLLKSLPKGVAAVYPWLGEQGVYHQLADIYVKSGWIERIGRGAYKRAGEKVDWLGGVYTLQSQAKMAVHPSGKTAIELHGNAHYVSARLIQEKVVLFGLPNEKLPAWFKNYSWNVQIRYTMTGLFKDVPSLGLVVFDCGNFEIKISSTERAAMEFCYDVGNNESFDELDLIFEGFTTLRPQLIQELLEKCNSVKTKRLFMYLAEKHHHAWAKRVDLKNVDFGTGNRSFCRSGHYNKKYKIVIPK